MNNRINPIKHHLAVLEAFWEEHPEEDGDGNPLFAGIPCANCGTCLATIFDGCSIYPGEGVCSIECLDEHDDLGCPLGDPGPEGNYYRECLHKKRKTNPG